MLPVEDIREQIVSALVESKRLIVSAPTGSGKSTQIPQMLLDENLVGDKEIWVLQPRRMATRMLARRVANERGAELGDEVGYQIRFDNKTSKLTRIRFVTEGILFRRLQLDKELSNIGAIVFDEFHERHLEGDLSLALTREIQSEKRPDLIMLVMSATIETDKLREYLTPCSLLEAEGVSFPVDVSYSPVPTLVDRPFVLFDHVAKQCKKLSLEMEGDVLIFMPGVFEIRQTINALSRIGLDRHYDLMPLHGELSLDVQERAVASGGKPKIIVSTNIAETSLTIEGVKVVIDSGLAKVSRFDSRRGINTLLVDKISRASADQRKGRAGRVSEGFCIRLWSKNDHDGRLAQEVPEIGRVDLSETVLSLKAMGVNDVRSFHWFEKPLENTLFKAEALLVQLGAIDRLGKLSKMGLKMSSFPLNPRFSRMLIESDKYKCVPIIATYSALTQTRNILLPLRDKALDRKRDELLGDFDSDYDRQVRVLEWVKENQYDYEFCKRWGIHLQGVRQVEKIKENFLDIAYQNGLDTQLACVDGMAYRRCLLIGFSDNIAKRTTRGTLHCVMTNGRKGELRRDSAARNESLIIPTDIQEQKSKNGIQVLLGCAVGITEALLEAVFPDDINCTSEVFFDEKNRKVVSSRQRRFRDLILSSTDSNEGISEGEASILLAKSVFEGKLKLKNWDEGVETWIHRNNFLAEYCSDYGFTKIGDDERVIILSEICQGSFSYKDIKNIDVWPGVKSWLSEANHALMDKLAPVEMSLPAKKRPVKIRYDIKHKPVLSATIQELYDCNLDLNIAGGNYSLLVELLAPNRRPVQLTNDLNSFWNGAYENIKKDLKGRYPKHEWR